MKKPIILFVFVLSVLLSACSKNEKEGVSEITQNIPKEVDEKETDEISKESDEDEMQAVPDEINDETKQIDFKGMLVSEADIMGDEIIIFKQDDFDGDGIDEAFALVGVETEGYDEGHKIVEGDVWFVSPNECKKLTQSSAWGFDEVVQDMTVGKIRYILFDEVYTTGSLTYVWYVDDGKAVDASFSKIGRIITDLDDKDSFCIQDSNYDALYDLEVGGLLGHTWKLYYFYYDDNRDKVCEFGGTEIDQSKAEYLCGFDIVGEMLPEGDEMTGLFYRSNGLVVMNYEHEEDGYVYNYHHIYDFIDCSFVDDNGEETTDHVPLEGVYAKALCPDIAVYPEDINSSGGLNIDNILEDKTGEIPSEVFAEIEGRYEDGYGDIVEISYPDHMIRFIKGGKQDHLYDEIICGYDVLDNAYLIKIEWDGEKYMYLYEKQGNLEYLYLLSDGEWEPKPEIYNTQALKPYIKIDE